MNVTFINHYQKNPESYGGTVVKLLRGTKIEWKNGKDITTVAKITAKKKLKKFYRPSFFQMFQIPFFLNESQNVSKPEDLEFCLWCGDIGLYFLESLIPKAVLYYTKEAVETINEENGK